MQAGKQTCDNILSRPEMEELVIYTRESLKELGIGYFMTLELEEMLK